MCITNAAENIELAQEQCGRIEKDTRGQSIHGNAIGYDLAGFLASREGMYDAPQTIFGDGVYRVGRDIVPGTYVANAGMICQWERWTSPIGVPASVISDSSSAGGEFLSPKREVNIAPDDAVFVSTGCDSWEKKY